MKLYTFAASILIVGLQAQPTNGMSLETAVSWLPCTMALGIGAYKTFKSQVPGDFTTEYEPFAHIAKNHDDADLRNDARIILTKFQEIKKEILPDAQVALFAYFGKDASLQVGHSFKMASNKYIVSFNPDIFLSPGAAVTQFTHNELYAMLKHELGHIKNDDLEWKASLLGTALSMLSFYVTGSVAVTPQLGLLIRCIAAPVTLIAMAVSSKKKLWVYKNQNRNLEQI